MVIGVITSARVCPALANALMRRLSTQGRQADKTAPRHLLAGQYCQIAVWQPPGSPAPGTYGGQVGSSGSPAPGQSGSPAPPRLSVVATASSLEKCVRYKEVFVFPWAGAIWKLPTAGLELREILNRPTPTLWSNLHPKYTALRHGHRLNLSSN